jgi:hypothetical protein
VTKQGWLDWGSLSFYWNSEPHFSLEDAKNTWRFIVDQLTPCLTGHSFREDRLGRAKLHPPSARARSETVKKAYSSEPRSSFSGAIEGRSWRFRIEALQHPAGASCLASSDSCLADLSALFKTSVDDAPDHTDLMLRRMLEKPFAAKFMTSDQQPTYNAAPSSLLPVILGRNPLEADAQVRISTPKYGHMYALSECSPIGTSIALRLGNSRICSAHQPKLAWNVRTRRQAWNFLEMIKTHIWPPKFRS